MSKTDPRSFARLPTFSEAIDVLASGFGTAMNREDALASRSSFGGRIDAYSGSASRKGLQELLLDVLAGTNEDLKDVLQGRLLDAETDLAEARSWPLVTEESAETGLRLFIELWAVPWFAVLLDDASAYQGTVLHSVRLLLDEHATGGESYLATWKSIVKRSLPEGASAPVFRSTIDRIDPRSQRKLASIQKDAAGLRLELQSVVAPPERLDAVVETIRGIYVAGMATMRFCARAERICPESMLLELLATRLRAGQSASQDNFSSQSRVRALWRGLHHREMPAAIQCLYDPRIHRWDGQRFASLLSAARAVAPAVLYEPFIAFAQGRWEMGHGRYGLAAESFQQVISFANERQLGNLAESAASLLIALRLAEPGGLKFEELNPLVRVRIDSMRQTSVLQVQFIPTPFSDFSDLPKTSVHDAHLLQCVGFFNGFPRAPGVVGTCNPIKRFDACLGGYLIQARERSGRLKSIDRNRPAITGTSIKPYQMLRDHLFYRDALFGMNVADIPQLDAYSMLPQCEQLRLLRYVDAEQFRLDSERYGLAGRRHPDD